MQAKTRQQLYADIMQPGLSVMDRAYTFLAKLSAQETMAGIFRRQMSLQGAVGF